MYQDDVMNTLESIPGGFRIFHERLFLNQSAAPVAVEEAGITASCNASPSAQLFQLVRNLVSVSVPDASGIIVKYREEFTIRRQRTRELHSKKPGPYFEVVTA